jgi:hypothetical protein
LEALLAARSETMSTKRLVHSDLELKFWQDGVPDVDAVRPTHCPGCGAASQCPGRPLTVVGHGVRERQLRGPSHVGTEPRLITIGVRRFRCRCCKAVMVVAPPEVLRYRLFSAVAITWALALYAVERLSAARVRHRISPWRVVGLAASSGWQTLRRWIGAAGAGTLLPGIAARDDRPRQMAASVVWALAARCPPSLRSESTAHQAVSGALHTLMGITP